MERKLIRLPQVLDKVGVTKTTLWNWHKKGTFPQRIKLTPRISVWDEAAVDAWIEATIESGGLDIHKQIDYSNDSETLCPQKG